MNLVQATRDEEWRPPDAVLAGKATFAPVGCHDQRSWAVGGESWVKAERSMFVVTHTQHRHPRLIAVE
jgi:hypothetical protein